MTTVRTPRGYPRKARIDRETLALFERLERVPQQQRSDQAFQADERSLHRWLGMEIIWLCGCASVLDRSSAPCWPDGRLACEAWASARKMRGELLEATGIGRRGPIREEAAGVRRAQAVITFIERLIVPSGAGEGSPIRLMDWQKDFVRDVYAPHRNGKRIVRRAVLSVARKQGKTLLTATIALAHLVGPEAIRNGEIYSAANDREQASIIYKFARQIIERDPVLVEAIDITSSTKTMRAKANGSIYRAVSSEAGTKHGYSPTVCIYDELAQSSSRELFDAFDTAFGAREEPLLIVISTQSNDPQHILSTLIDDGLSELDPSIICHLYAADEGCDLDDEAQWLKANPALGVFRDREDLAASIRKAMRMPADEPRTRNLLLNQRVSPAATLIGREEWTACAEREGRSAEFRPGEAVYLGLDLASVIDLCALAMVSEAEPVRVASFAWKPRELLAEHSYNDFGAGNLRYVEWANAGELLTSPGRAIDPAVVATTIAELCGRYQVRGMAYDPAYMDTLLREFDRIGFRAYRDAEPNRLGTGQPARSSAARPRADGLRIIPWRQGFISMAPAVNALEAAVVERKLIHPNNLPLNWCIGNAMAVTDAAGNRKLDKSAARFRIDAAQALCMAMGLRASDRGGPVKFDAYALIGAIAICFLTIGVSCLHFGGA